MTFNYCSSVKIKGMKASFIIFFIQSILSEETRVKRFYKRVISIFSPTDQTSIKVKVEQIFAEKYF